MIKSFLYSLLILLCTVIFESAILSNITLLPAVPDLSLLCILYFSLHNGKIYGELTGFSSGMFLDFLSACPMGLNCLIRTLIGYFAGLFNKDINTSGVFIPFFLGIIVTLIKVGLIFVFSLLYPGIIYTYKIISIKFLLHVLLNGFLCPLVFRFLDMFRKSIVIEPETYY